MKHSEKIQLRSLLNKLCNENTDLNACDGACGNCHIERIRNTLPTNTKAIAARNRTHDVSAS